MAEDTRLEDLEGIRQARIAYSHFWDAGDVEGTASIFTDDAVIETRYGDKPYAAGGAIGKDAIREFYARHAKGRGQALHIVTNPLIEFTGPDSAKGVWILTDVAIGQAGPGRPPQILYGRYTDQYRKVDGKWKIQRMEVDVLWLAEQWFDDHNLVQS